jgi:hypothetical protein
MAIAIVCFVAGRALRARQSRKMLGRNAAAGDHRPHHDLGAGVAHGEDRRDGHDQARHGEHHRERIAADHPAAVLHEVAVAHAVERDRGRDHPAQRLHDRCGEEGGGADFRREHDGHRRGDEDAHDVHVAEYPVQREIACAQAVGELERAQRQGQRPEEPMGDEETQPGREVPRHRRSRIEESRVLHVRHENRERSEDQEEDELELRARDRRGGVQRVLCPASTGFSGAIGLPLLARDSR